MLSIGDEPATPSSPCAPIRAHCRPTAEATTARGRVARRRDRLLRCACADGRRDQRLGSPPWKSASILLLDRAASISRPLAGAAAWTRHADIKPPRSLRPRAMPRPGLLQHQARRRSGPQRRSVAKAHARIYCRARLESFERGLRAMRVMSRSCGKTESERHILPLCRSDFTLHDNARRFTEKSARVIATSLGVRT